MVNFCSRFGGFLIRFWNGFLSFLSGNFDYFFLEKLQYFLTLHSFQQNIYCGGKYEI